MDQTLLVFVTVAEKKNFTRTAETLCMTQPAVSQYIQNLERAVGTKLLERNNKYVRLNRAGEIVYHHAKEILGLYTRMNCLVDDLMHTARGDLSIGASYTFGEYVLPHVIALLHQRFPLIKPSITIGNTRDIAEVVLTHKIDVGIIEGDFNHDSIAVEPFAEDRMHVVCSPSHCLANQDKISHSDLEAQTWIIREIGSGTREATEKVFTGLNIHPKEIMEFGSTQIIKESVEAGLGISLLSHWAIRKEVKMGKMKLLLLESGPVLRDFSLIIPSTPFHTKAAEVFLDLLRGGEGFPDS